jgi:hypothetical protein
MSKQVLDPGGDRIRLLRKRGWWQRVNRTPKGWALSVSSNQAWVEAEGGEPVLVIERWFAKPNEVRQDHYIIISPSHGFLLVEEKALK